MNKAQLIAHIAAEANISKVTAARALDAFISGVTASLQNDDSVMLAGLGTFAVFERTARQGRDPRSGETITIRASKSPRFKPGKALKDALNQGE